MGVKLFVIENGSITKTYEVDGQNVTRVDAGLRGKNILLSKGPDNFPLVMFHNDKFYFSLPPYTFNGFVEKRSGRYSIDELVQKGIGKESQGLIWGIVDPSTLVEIENQNLKVVIAGENRVSEIEKRYSESREKSESKVAEGKTRQKQTVTSAQPLSLAGAGGPSVGYFDFHEMRKRTAFVYFVILSISVVIAVVMMGILGSMKLPPEKADITAIPTRFAKLIVENVPKPEKKKEVGTGEKKEEKQTKAQKMEETKEQEKAATGNVSEKARKEAIRRKIRHVGVIAILTSKGGQGIVKDVVSAANSIGDLDQVLSSMGGVETAKAGMDIEAIKKTRVGGAVASADIGSLGVGPGQKVALGSKKIRRVRASINLGGGKISGALAGEVIRRTVRRNINGVKYCYEKELKRNPKLQGKIVVLFTIGRDGRVKKARIQSTTMHNEAVESCILRMIRRWRFPRPEKGSVTVSYPFIFTPGS